MDHNLENLRELDDGRAFRAESKKLPSKLRAGADLRRINYFEKA